MEFAVMLPTFGDSATPKALRELATTAEHGGFDALWAGDHVVFPSEVPNTYPFSSDGTPPSVFAPDQNVYDVFTVLSYLAGITDTIAVGSNVCIVPYRHPVALAKIVLTLDVLTDHRVELGVGTGWLETEFEVLDVPFSERGSRTNEFLDMFTQICDTGILSFDGLHHSFQETGFYPIPENQPPVWIGGGSDATFTRVGKYGTGWTTLWKHPDDISGTRDRILDAWTAHDREGEPDIAVWRPIHLGDDTEHDTSRPLVGEPGKVIDDIHAYADAGVTRLVLDFFTDDLTDQLHQLNQVADDVIPAI